MIDRSHPQYAGSLEVEEAAKIIAGASGKSGPNHSYVENTVQHMRDMGIRDAWLEGVARCVAREMANEPRSS